MVYEGDIVRIQRTLVRGQPNPNTGKVYRNFETLLRDYCSQYPLVADSYDAYKGSCFETLSVRINRAIGEVVNVDDFYYTIKLSHHGAMLIDDPENFRICACFIIKDPEESDEIINITKLHLSKVERTPPQQSEPDA